MKRTAKTGKPSKEDWAIKQIAADYGCSLPDEVKRVLKDGSYLAAVEKYYGRVPDNIELRDALLGVKSFLNNCETVAKAFLKSGGWDGADFECGSNEKSPTHITGKADQEPLVIHQIPTLYQKVLSVWIAQGAARHPKVRRFRSEILKETLKRPDEIEQWIQQQAELQPRISAHALTLWYCVPNDTSIRWIRAVAPGVLYDLGELSNRLAEEFHWHAAEATCFVLAGCVPADQGATDEAEAACFARAGFPSGTRPPMVRIIDFSVSLDIRNFVSAMSRINLSIDLALSSREVGAEYARWRERFASKNPHILKPKSLHLALFAAAEGIVLLPQWHPLGKFDYVLVSKQGKSWREHMNDWNRRYGGNRKKYSYSHPDHFKDMCQDALQRLLHPDYQEQPKAKP